MITFAAVSKLVDAWIDPAEHRGEIFDLDLICKRMNVVEPETRHQVSKKLSYEVSQGNLEKTIKSSRALFSVVDKTVTSLNDWPDAPLDETLNIQWPVSHQDATEFGFDKTFIVPAGGLIVVAGVSNAGKTGFMQNFCIENADIYHVTMMINEANKSMFRRRINRMTWFNPLGTNGKVKFDLIERHGDWKYAVQPDDINIIDWIDMPDGDFYKINGILDGIKSRLGRGIAVVALQKSEGKGLGTGGQFSEHLANIYLNIDYGRLTVRKCKEWNAPNPNGRTWGFEIVEGGSQFADIREIKLCPKCGGRCLTAHTHCDNCHAKGWVDVTEVVAV